MVKLLIFNLLKFISARIQDKKERTTTVERKIFFVFFEIPKMNVDDRH